jgi:aldose sugar dehydrogenase
MLMRRGLAAILCVSLIVAIGGCGGDDDEPPPISEPDPVEPRPAPDERPDGAAAGPLDFEDVQTLAQGLEVPWALAFADEDRILVTERPGRVRLIEGGELRNEPVAEIDVTHEGEGGLLGIALHPGFPEPRAGYLYYTLGGENRLSRFRVGDDLSFSGEEVLLSAPASQIHNGGHIAFGPDGLLHAATGDAGEPALAADEDSLGGKILRLQPGGAPAGDEAFAGSPVLSFGHRNPQGFDWDSEGRLYASEHGPTGEFGLCCHDEVNLIEGGEFYGWPFLAGDAPAQEGEPPQRPVPPIAESGPDDTWAPAGLAVHEPAGEPIELLVANLRGEELMRVVIAGDDPGEVAGVETAIDDLGRLRAAVLGPDGCLYLTTSNTDGRGSPRDGDDRVARVCERG